MTFRYAIPRFLCIVVLLIVISTGMVSASSTGTMTAIDVVNRYYDLFDYMTSQAFGYQHATSVEQRSASATYLTSAWPQLDDQTRSAFLDMADYAPTISTKFNALGKTEQATTLNNWKGLLLSPQWLYFPLASTLAYDNQGLSFQYPASWGTAQGNSILFLGPDLNTTWEAVGQAASSPAGILLAAFDKNLYGYSLLELARVSARQYVGDLAEVYALETQLGALVVLDGRFSNQQEEKFFWVALIPADEFLLLARMGGPVIKADQLVPAFLTVLNSLNLPQQQEPGPYSSAFDTAWNHLSTSVVKYIWTK